VSAINMRDVSGAEQLALLVSKRDRMVTVRDKTGHLCATVTVVTDPDGSVSIGIAHCEDRASVYVEYMDDDGQDQPQ